MKIPPFANIITQSCKYRIEFLLQEGKRKIILNMSNSGYPLVEIAKITDMTEEKVKEILKHNDVKL
ncbi:hypothetical protein I230019B6_23170 [Firmicutes bacterium i23-0019-B6]|jgi:hypothetical protein